MTGGLSGFAYVVRLVRLLTHTTNDLNHTEKHSGWPLTQASAGCWPMTARPVPAMRSQHYRLSLCQQSGLRYRLLSVYKMRHDPVTLEGLQAAGTSDRVQRSKINFLYNRASQARYSRNDDLGFLGYSSAIATDLYIWLTAVIVST